MLRFIIILGLLWPLHFGTTFSECCRKVVVEFVEPNSNVFNIHPYLYTEYELQQDAGEEKVYYTSKDGKRVITYCDQGPSWIMTTIHNM